LSLVDEWMPEADAWSRHATTIAAPPARVWEALLKVEFGRHPLVALLMGIRALPALLTRPRTTWARLRRRSEASALPLGTLLRQDFALLAERPLLDMVLGVTGRFWLPSGELSPTDPATFRDPVPPGHARAVWSFHLEPLADGRTRLVTETRVRCADPATRRSFLRYWRLIAPGSGLIRRAILSMIRRRAEAAVL
jgi:hypothetical protein